MTASLLYCPACGAANAPDHAACFACQQPLALHIAINEQTNLLRDRYQLLTQLGMGGYGAVYKALDTREQNRVVAIKQINLRGLTPQEVIEATDGFNREVQMLSQLSHAHLPRVHAHFTDPEHWYVVLDFIEGETLEHYLRDITFSQENAVRALLLDEVLDIGLQLCSVLAYLHAQQPPIIYRDLKPSNIMRTSRGQLYLIDFGAARYFKPGQSKDTIPLGSPGYAAPEQYGRAQTTPRTDVYSLGALLHYLISRRDPSETPFSFAPLSAYGPTGLSELETLVLRMVELDPERRPAGIGEVEAELRRIRELRASAEPRIWRAVPGQVPPPVLAPGAYLPPPVRQQMQQHMQAVTMRKKKTRRKFLVGSLAVTSSLALGGFSYWRYWHPARLVLDSRFSRSLSSPLLDISTIAWSLDGTCIAFGANDGSITASRLLQSNGNFTILSLSSSFPPANAPTQPINALAWSPDNTSLLVLTQDGQLQVRDSNLQKISTLATAITTAAWAPNGINIFALNEQGDGILFLYNPDTGAGLPLGSRGLNLQNVLAWSPDGTRIAAEQVMEPGSHVLLIMSTDVDQMDTSISLGPSTITALTWSPDGHYLAALDVTGTLQVWDMQNSNNLVFSKSITTQQNQLAWSTDSRFLAAIDDANELLVLDRSSGDTLVSAPIADPLGRGSAFPGRALTWLDSQHIALTSNNMEYWIWNLPWF